MHECLSTLPEILQEADKKKSEKLLKEVLACSPDHDFFGLMINILMLAVKSTLPLRTSEGTNHGEITVCVHWEPEPTDSPADVKGQTAVSETSKLVSRTFNDLLVHIKNWIESLQVSIIAPDPYVDQ